MALSSAIEVRRVQLPANIEDLSKFALIGREKLQAVRAEIAAIEKVGLASEVLEQKRSEAQEIAELVTLSEMRMGEMLREIPKQQGARTDIQPHRTDAKKSDVLSEIGITKDTANRFEQMAAHPDIVERAIAEARENDDIVSRASVLKMIKAERKRTQAAERLARKEYVGASEFPEDMCELFAADIRDGLFEIQDGSVDAIVTDPPYPREHIGLYGDLAEVASRVLRPGGSLVAMAGQSYLPEVLEQIEGFMEYRWCLAYLTPGGRAPHLFTRNVNTFWKPVVWCVKGRYEGDCIGDVLRSDPNDNDKRFHEWGQSVSGFTEIIERFTDPGHTILDPFLGGGTTGIVALSMGRRFIGCDIDGELVKAAEKRMRDAYARS